MADLQKKAMSSCKGLKRRMPVVRKRLMDGCLLQTPFSGEEGNTEKKE
jgi:hypothetical protein